MMELLIVIFDVLLQIAANKVPTYDVFLQNYLKFCKLFSEYVQSSVLFNR